MALTAVALTRPKASGTHVVPAVDPTSWIAVCKDPKTADTANLLKPSDIVRAGQLQATMGYAATSVRACLRYTTGVAVTTAPVIQLAGIDANGIPQLLADENGSKSFTLTVNTGTDLKDAGGFSYTSNILCDARNSTAIIVLVSTALVGGGTVDTTGNTGPAIMLLAQ